MFAESAKNSSRSIAAEASVFFFQDIAMTDRDRLTGRFLPGNRFWEARASCGPNPKFKSAKQLSNACFEYFDWAESNPLHEAKAFAYEGLVTVEAMPKLRAFTLIGLCNFIGISRETWNEWRSTRPDLSDIITRAEAIIYQQKFEGAASGLLVPNIIARDLGLADKQEVTGKDGGPVQIEDVSARDILADKLSRLAARNGTGSDTGEPDGSTG